LSVSINQFFRSVFSWALKGSLLLNKICHRYYLLGVFLRSSLYLVFPGLPDTGSRLRIGAELWQDQIGCLRFSPDPGDNVENFYLFVIDARAFLA
jgi:hypothetical protein